MKKFVSFLVVLFLSLNPWDISAESALAITNTITALTPVLAGIGLLILAWEWLEEAIEYWKGH